MRLAVLLLVLTLLSGCAAPPAPERAPDMPLSFAVSVPPAVPAAVEEAALEQTRGEAPLYLLPLYAVDEENAAYAPLESIYGGGTWFFCTAEGRLYSINDAFSPDLILVREGTDDAALCFDASLGRDLAKAAEDEACAPLFFVDIGQKWLLAQDGEGDLRAYGYGELDGPLLSLSEDEFLRGLARFRAEIGPRVTGGGARWLPPEDYRNAKKRRGTLTIGAGSRGVSRVFSCSCQGKAPGRWCQAKGRGRRRPAGG